MSEPMWVATLTQEEWTYLHRMSLNAAGVPSGLKFALESATIAQNHMVEERNINTVSSPTLEHLVSGSWDDED